jgi:hypothetical protein
MRINRSYLLGGVWWGFVFGCAVVGCARYFVVYTRAGNHAAALAAGLIGISCAVLGVILLGSVFNERT